MRWDFVMSQILKLKALKIADLRKMLKCFDWWVIVSHQFPLAGYGTVALANNAAHLPFALVSDNGFTAA